VTVRHALLVAAAAVAFAASACEPKPGSPPKPKTIAAAMV